MNMPPIPASRPQAEPSAGVACCHLYDKQSRERLMSCPCASLHIAQDIAQTQKETINLVESAVVFEAYRDGQLIFRITTPNQFAAWKQKLQLKEPNEDNRTRLTYVRAKGHRAGRQAAHNGNGTHVRDDRAHGHRPSRRSRKAA